MNILNVIVGACLICIPVISYFEGSGLNGIIPLIQEHFSINDSQTAIILTATSITRTGTLALVWLFGDMFKRRTLFLWSVALWIILSLLAIVLGSNSFLVFIALRALAAVPSAVFGVLVPVILADLFKDRALGIALTGLFLTESLSGMSAMTVSSWIVTSGLPWQTTFIAVPLLALVPFLVLLCAKKMLKNVEQKDRSIGKNFTGVFSILSIKSYVLLTIALAIHQFHTQGYNFWFPSMYLIIFENKPEVFLGLSFPSVTTISTVSLVVGMGAGFFPVMWFAQSWRHGTGPFSGRGEYLRAYPIVLTIGSSMTSAMFITSILLLDRSFIACVVVTFFVGFATTADMALTQQIILMVVSSNRRAAAIALFRLFSAVFSIPSAQLIGTLTDLFRGDSALPLDRFSAFQKGMMCESVLLLISGICCVMVVVYFPKDFERAEKEDANEEKTCLLEKHESKSMVNSRTTSFNTVPCIDENY